VFGGSEIRRKILLSGKKPVGKNRDCDNKSQGAGKRYVKPKATAEQLYEKKLMRGREDSQRKGKEKDNPQAHGRHARARESSSNGKSTGGRSRVSVMERRLGKNQPFGCCGTPKWKAVADTLKAK